MDLSRRVVVTGMGVISSLGNDVDTFWNNLVAGKSGIGPLTKFDTTKYSCKIASEVKDFDPHQFMDPKEAKYMDTYIHFAIAASKLALKNASLDHKSLDPKRFGVIIGTGIGGMRKIQDSAHTLFEKGPRYISPFMIPGLISNMASGVTAMELGAQGPSYAIVSACASGTHSIGEAYRSILFGDAEIMIAGGSEAAIAELSFSGFCSMRTMSTSFNDCPSRACRPFDAKRDGFVMGEGAGILVLESLEHAQKRGVKIYCELAGYSATCDAYHITSPDPEASGLSLCFERVLQSAKLPPESVDYINAHGTSTSYNDKFETLAIKKVFGEHARKVKISSTKSMTGHLLGAAGGVEAIACIKSIETGIVPPTINYEFPDPDCDLDYVPNKSIRHTVNVAISDNLGFGGQNAAVLFKRL